MGPAAAARAWAFWTRCRGEEGQLSGREGMPRWATDWRCAACGGAGRAEQVMFLPGLEVSWPASAVVRDMVEPEGLGRIGEASGQPQVVACCWAPVARSWPEYRGSEVLAWVARQLRMVNGLSMLISKCRRRLPAGSSGSIREIRRTTCGDRVSCKVGRCSYGCSCRYAAAVADMQRHGAGGREVGLTNLNPVIHIGILPAAIWM